MKKLLKIFFIGIIIACFLALAGHLLLQYRARQVVQLLATNLSNGKYNADAKKVKIGYFPLSVHMKSFSLQPTNSNENLLSITANSIELKLGSVLKLLLQKKLQVKSMHIFTPNILATAPAASKTKLSAERVAITLAAIQKKLFETFEELAARDVNIMNASITINAANQQKRLFSVNHINLHIKEFDVSKDRIENKAKLVQQVTLNMQHPTLYFEDTNLLVKVGQVQVDAVNGNLKIDSIDIRHKRQNQLTENIQLSSIAIKNFNWTRFLKEAHFEIDTVLINKGIATLDLSKDENKTLKKEVSATDYKGSSFLIHHAAISNISYNIRTKDEEDANVLSLVKLKGNRLSANEISLMANRNPALDVKELNINITDFIDADSNSKYQSTLSDLQINNGTLLLRNYRIAAKDGKGNNGDKLIIPVLKIEQYSLSDLLLKRIVAERLLVQLPTIDVTILKQKNKASKSLKNINKFVDDLMQNIQKNININQLDVENAAIHLKPYQAPNQALKLAGLSLRINGKKVLQANNLMEAIHAVEQLKTKGFTLTGKYLDLKVSDVSMLDDLHGYYIGHLQGQFGAGALVDFYGVRLYNENYTIDITQADGLYASKLSVERGTIALQDLNANGNNPDANKLLPELKVDQLELNNIVLKINKQGKISSTTAFNLHATGATFLENIAYWNTLSINSSLHQMEVNGTQFSAGSMQLQQPGKIIIHQAKGSTQTPGGKIDFAAAKIEADLGIANSRPSQLHMQQLLLTNPVLHIELNKVAEKNTTNKPPRKSSPPYFIQQLILQDPQIELVKKGSRADTILFTQSLQGQLICQNLSFIDSNGLPKLTAQHMQFQNKGLRQIIKKNNASYAFHPSALKLEASNLSILPTKPFVQFFVDTLQLTDLHHTFFGNRSDTTEISLATIGAARYAFSSNDSINWKQLIFKNRWWSGGGTITHKTPLQILSVSGVKANHDAQLSFAFDSITLKKRMDRETFWQQEPFEKDYITFSTGAGTASKVTIDLTKQIPPIHIQQLSIDGLNLVPQRDKTRPVDTVSYRPLLARQLMKLPLPLQIDHLQLSNGTVQYYEIAQKTSKEALLAFTDIHGNINHIKTHEVKQTDSLDINIQAMLFGQGRLNLNFRQSYTDSLQSFRMRTQMGPFNLAAMNAFFRPELGIFIKAGQLDSLGMLVNGNDHWAYGSMDLRYQKMKLIRMNAKGEEKYFFAGQMNWFINQLIKTTANNKPHLLVKKREQKRGTFNFWAKMTIEGMLANLKITTDRKEKKAFKKIQHLYPAPSNDWQPLNDK